MARITVEDCTEVVQNRFELVVIAARRGKDIASGSPISVAKDNDKNAVIALREIAAKRVDVKNLKTMVIQSYRKNIKSVNEEESATEIQEISEEQVFKNNKLNKDITEEIKSLTTIEDDKDEDLMFVDEDIETED